jgi:hypothetical protein
MSFFDDLREATAREYQVGSEENREAMMDARKAKKLSPDGPRARNMLGAYRTPQAIRAVLGLPLDKDYTKAREDVGIPFDVSSKGKRAGTLLGSLGADYKRKPKYGGPGAIQAMSIPAGIAINTGLGLMTPFGGAEGYKAALPSEEDPSKTSNVIGEVAAKYLLGRTGNLLPYPEFVKVRPDVSGDEYGRYKAFKFDKPDINPFDDGK